jgi:ubiquinone/menaquinone biosynthesis C-methylase UbiE
MYIYSPENAALYNQLAIKGTTYEPIFDEMARLLGSLEGETALDFGCGTGRTARFLLTLNAQKVIGVDHNITMLSLAKQANIKNAEFYLIEKELVPLPDNSVDVALSHMVFVECKSLEQIKQALCEIYRVLKPGGQCVIVSGNPESVGHEFVSWVDKKPEGFRSGSPIICTIKGEKPFIVEDVCWLEQDYHDVLKSVGFQVNQVTFPLAKGEGWLSETRISPAMLFDARKP